VGSSGPTTFGSTIVNTSSFRLNKYAGNKTKSTGGTAPAQLTNHYQNVPTERLGA